MGTNSLIETTESAKKPPQKKKKRLRSLVSLEEYDRVLSNMSAPPKKDPLQPVLDFKDEKVTLPVVESPITEQLEPEYITIKEEDLIQAGFSKSFTDEDEVVYSKNGLSFFSDHAMDTEGNYFIYDARELLLYVEREKLFMQQWHKKMKLLKMIPIMEDNNIIGYTNKHGDKFYINGFIFPNELNPGMQIPIVANYNNKLPFEYLDSWHQGMKDLYPNYGNVLLNLGKNAFVLSKEDPGYTINHQALLSSNPYLTPEQLSLINNFLKKDLKEDAVNLLDKVMNIEGDNWYLSLETLLKNFDVLFNKIMGNKYNTDSGTLTLAVREDPLYKQAWEKFRNQYVSTSGNVFSIYVKNNRAYLEHIQKKAREEQWYKDNPMPERSFDVYDKPTPEYEIWKEEEKKAKQREFRKFGGIINKHQQGGKMNQQNLQQQVVQLVQAAAQGDPNANKQIEQIMQAAQNGDQQAILIAQLIQQVIQAMLQLSGGIKAQLGAKLNYIRKIKGLCPEGQELVYMKEGGRMCAKCMQKALNGAKTSQKPVNAVLKFKKDKKKKQIPMPTKYDGKKHERLALLNADPKKKLTPAQTDSLNTYARLYRELPDSIKVRDYNDQEVQAKACGGKAKKH